MTSLGTSYDIVFFKYLNGYKCVDMCKKWNGILTDLPLIFFISFYGIYSLEMALVLNLKDYVLLSSRGQTFIDFMEGKPYSVRE